MTIAITVKVHDGVVLAADSASTLYSPRGTTVDHVYNNANKVFNLYKSCKKKPEGLPIGVITYGLGGIGNSSISTLIKDFRHSLMTNGDDWGLKVEDYTIKDIADSFKSFIFDDNYKPTFADSEIKPDLGFIIAGYSSNAPLAEEYRLEIRNGGQCFGPELIRKPEEVGVAWGGDMRAISRLIFGFDPQLPLILKDVGVKDAEIPQLINFIKSKTEIGIIPPAMPIQDAIDVAKFLAETTINFTHFLPEAPIVGGPIEIATITKHEQFKWITRKHYYDEKYNRRITYENPI